MLTIMIDNRLRLTKGLMHDMFKKIGWLAKTIAAGLILSFLSVWTTGYIVTSYVDTILKQYNLPLEVPPMAMAGVWGKLWGSNPPMTEEDPGVNGGTTSQTGSLSEETAGQASDEPDSVDAFGEIDNPPLTDIGGGSGSEAGGSPAEPDSDSGGGEIDGTETAVTTDEMTEVKEQMTDHDKEALFGLLMSKLPQESWQAISEYVEEGLTEQELTDIQQIMAQYLDKAEYEQMMDILKKY